MIYADLKENVVGLVEKFDRWAEIAVSRTVARQRLS